MVRVSPLPQQPDNTRLDYRLAGLHDGEATKYDAMVLAVPAGPLPTELPEIKRFY